MSRLITRSRQDCRILTCHPHRIARPNPALRRHIFGPLEPLPRHPVARRYAAHPVARLVRRGRLPASFALFALAYFLFAFAR